MSPADDRAPTSAPDDRAPTSAPDDRAPTSAPGDRALVADVEVRRGDLALAATLDVAPGRVLAVLGPNGAGKSTLLGAVAGTVRVRRGMVRVGPRVLTRAGCDEPDVQVPVARRAVGLLGQDPLVFPHLDALENVAFGPRAAGVRPAAARREARAWLDAVGLADLARRRPDELSGGQRQRVALARALAARPAALLLDEPFTQLDVRAAAELRALVRRHVRAAGVPAVLVTHDVVDVLAVADEVVVLHDGAVVERGDPVAVLTDPVHPFTAALADLVVLRGELREPHGAAPVLVGAGLTVRVPARWARDVAQERGRADGPVRVQVTFSPGDVRPGADDADALAWSARVVDVERGPRGVRLRTDGDVLVDLAAADAVAHDLLPGAHVALRVACTDVRVRRV